MSQVWTEKATNYCERVPNPRKADIVQRNLEAVQAALKEREKRRGTSIEEIAAELHRKETALNTVKKMDKTAYFFSQELDPNGTKIADGNALKAKVVHVAYVSKYHQSKGLNAKEWVETSAQHVGGKGGGKADSAQGVGEMGGQALDDAIEAARRVFVLKCEESGVPLQ